jgi:hypothetical protein
VGPPVKPEDDRKNKPEDDRKSKPEDAEKANHRTTEKMSLRTVLVIKLAFPYNQKPIIFMR